MKNIFTLITALLIFTYCHAQKEILTLNLTKGETYFHKLSTNMNIVQSMNATEMNMKMELSTKLSYKVIDIKDSVYEMGK